MGQRDEGTNGLPPKLEAKLVEAKEWYDQNPDGLTGEEVDAANRKGADLLMDIVEAVEETWGFAK